MAQRILPVLFFVLVLSAPVHAFRFGIGGGGYVPFGRNTQKDSDGATEAKTLHPMLNMNAVVALSGAHLFLPEIGYVRHRKLFDDYKKSTVFLLADFAYVLRSRFLIRYGLGMFMTSISSDGGPIEQRNGSGTMTFYKPTEDGATSYNGTLNFGFEGAITRNFALRFETYTFAILSSLKRDASYSFSLHYIL